jgi:hypothetical protein
LAGEEEAEVDFGVVAGGCAARDEAAADGEAGDAVKAFFCALSFIEW